MQKISGIIGFLMFCCIAVNGQIQKVTVSLAKEAVLFDGMPDESAWDDCATVPLIAQTPIYGENPSEKTDVLMTHDDDYLYVAGRLFDSEPHKIMANSYKRDALIGNTDWFGFLIDSFNDKQNALGFFTNPNGLRLDANVINDAYGRNPINVDWNAVWDVKTAINDKGWFVEMRIPFSSIPFQTINGEVTMGFITWRYIARKNETDIFPGITTEFGEWSSWKPSQAHEIIIKDVKRKKPLYIAPYVISGITSVAEEVEGGYETETDTKLDFGLDVRYGLTDNLNLDLSYNTDFAQVEADDQQINLTRFSLFFPEKRLFFQERAGIFNFGFGRQDQLFYSRRIGIYDGSPVKIYGGARMVGRVGTLDIGMLDMQTESVDTIPSLNHSVFRLKKQIINDNSDIGLLVTNQMDFDGNYVHNIGFDSRIRYTKKDFVNIKYAQTYSNDLSNRLIDPNAGRWFVSFLRQERVGFIYAASFSKAGKDFNPSLGFMQREDFYRVGHRIGYGWLPGETSPLQTHSLTYRGSWFRNNEIGETDSYFGGPQYSFNTKRGTMGSVEINYRHENIIESFDISDEIIIQPRKYNFISSKLSYTTPFNKPFFASYSLEYGSFYSGSKTTFEFKPNWTVSSNLELSATYLLNHLVYGDITETLSIARIKGLLMFNTTTSISSFIQFNSTSKAFLANIRFRYNPWEGNDLFLVFNDNLNLNRNLEIPRLPFSNERTIVFKYTYTFRS